MLLFVLLNSKFLLNLVHPRTPPKGKEQSTSQVYCKTVVIALNETQSREVCFSMTRSLLTYPLSHSWDKIANTQTTEEEKLILAEVFRGLGPCKSGSKVVRCDRRVWSGTDAHIMAEGGTRERDKPFRITSSVNSFCIRSQLPTARLAIDSSVD